MPERLRYLQPFREFLARIPKSEVGDATDTSLLEELLHERIRGLTAKEAHEKLRDDLKELEEYLSDRPSDRLHFLVGFLLIAVEKPEELIKPPSKLIKSECRLIMELPPRSKCQSDEYSLTINWKRQHFHALKCNMEDEFSRKYTWAKLARPNENDYALLKSLGMSVPLVNSNPPQTRAPAISVSLGKVTGHKRIDFSESPLVWKRADYLLEVPGGYVEIVIQARHLFDDSEWDPYLATLRCANPNASDSPFH